jgi:PAS domain S-box-containing protein
MGDRGEEKRHTWTPMCEREWEDTFNAVPDLVLIIDKEYKIVRANMAASERLDMSPDELLGSYCFKVVHGTDGPPDYCPHSRLLADGREHIEKIYEEQLKGHFLASVSPLYSEDGQLRGSVHVIRDVSKLMRTEEELEDSRSYVLSILNGLSEPVMVIGLDRRVILLNRAAEEFSGIDTTNAEEAYCYKVSHQRNSPCVSEELHPCPLEEVRRTGGPVTVVHEHFKDEEGLRYVEILASPLHDSGGNMTGIIESMRDITERERAAEALRESEEKFRSLAEQSPNMIFINQGGRVVYVNKRCEEIMGYTKDEFYSPYFDFLAIIASESKELVNESFKKHMAGEEVDPYEYTLITRDGKHLDAIITTKLISYGGESAILGIITDISERKRMEDNLRRYVTELEKYSAELAQSDGLIKASLEEKEILMREIHHRVKNNLAVISSLLNLQSAQIKDEEARDIFKETQNRVKSMSMIHERLYRSADLKNVNFSEYIRTLATQLFSSYEATGERVKLSINVPDMSVDVNTMIPCGLIMNELVSNALKHAFPGERDGRLKIEVFHEGGMYTLSVKDNGVGVPPDLDIHSTRTLGMQIINSLTRQLGGTVELVREGGTEFRITFREKHFPAKT